MFDDVPTSLLGIAWRAGKLGWRKWPIIKCWWTGLRLGQETIRVSCAQLIRVQRGNRFLLVPNQGRVPQQMQPPGGVVKVRSDGQAFLREIGAHPDGAYAFDDKDEGDLRIRVPGKNLMRFLGWYVSGKGRESSPADREFREELVETGILPADLFGSPKFTANRRVMQGPKHSAHFNCTELLVHEVFDLVDLSSPQEEHLKALQAPKHCGARVGAKAKFGWFTGQEIVAGGHFAGADKQHWKIGEHAGWMI